MYSTVQFPDRLWKNAASGPASTAAPPRKPFVAIPPFAHAPLLVYPPQMNRKPRARRPKNSAQFVPLFQFPLKRRFTTFLHVDTFSVASPMNTPNRWLGVGLGAISRRLANCHYEYIEYRRYWGGMALIHR